jgi:hypothetical protein
MDKLDLNIQKKYSINRIYLIWLIYSIIFGIYGFTLCLYLLKFRGFFAADFQWQIRAGEALINAENPYTVIPWGNVFPLGVPYINPLPAAIVGIPFTFIDPYFAGSLFLVCHQPY